MKAKDRDALKKKLLERRQALVLRVGLLADTARTLCAPDASGACSVVPDHPADRATDEFEEEFALGLIENGGDELLAIDHALEKIREGTYGICERCDRKIGLKRLRAVPYARLCIRCKRAKEEQSKPTPCAFSSAAQG